MEKVKLFVYGTLMYGFRNFEKYLKDAKVVNIKKAYTKGTLYHLNKKKCPALIEGNDKVWGQLLEINDDKELSLLKELDKMEKYFEDSEEIMYERKKINVFVENGQLENAYAYIFVNIKNMDKYEPKYVKTGKWKNFVI